MGGHPAVTPDISVVIPTRNRARSLRRTLAALARQTDAAERFEVIVVANDCTDETSPLVRGLAAPYPLRLLELPTPGMSLARNTGAAAAQGRVVLLLDDDIEPLPGFTAAHARAHESDPGLVAVGHLLAPSLPRPFSFFVERLHNLDAAFASFLAEAQEPLDWFCMIGGNCSMPKALFLKAGGFDTSLVTYGGEDYEFGCRLQKMGAHFRFLPDAGGFHYAHENKSVAAYLGNARSVGRNDVYIMGRHPEIIDRLRIGLVARPQTLIGGVARTLAFDYPQWGDLLVKGLGRISVSLGWLRARRPWNRVMDCLYQYWYFRGVRDELGGYRAAAAYVTRLRFTASERREKEVSGKAKTIREPHLSP